VIWVFFVLAVGFAFCGLLIWIVVELAWQWARPVFSTAWPKPTLSILKGSSGMLGIVSKGIETPSQQLATWTAGIFLVGLLFWELIDNRSTAKRDTDKKGEEEDFKRREADFASVVEQAYLRTKLLASLGEVVAYKKQRVLSIVRRVLDGGFSRNAPDAHRAGLSPQEQTLLILQALTSFLHESLPRCENSERQNFRVGFYVERNGRMEPKESWDHRRKARQFLTSYIRFPDKFNLACENKAAYAVRCIQERKLLIVTNCLEEDACFHVNQENYLRSLIAFPILDFIDLKQPIAASIVVDTDEEGFFKEEDRSTIESYMEQFALRLDLEAVAEMLLSPVGVSSRGEKGRRKE